MKDLFGDDAPIAPAPKRPAARRAPPPAPPAPPPTPPPPAPRPRRESALRTGEAAKQGAEAEERNRVKEPCPAPFHPGGGERSHRCSVGGGYAAHTVNGGLTWECAVHVAPSYWPKNRRKAP